MTDLAVMDIHVFKTAFLVSVLVNGGPLTLSVYGQHTLIANIHSTIQTA